MVVITSDENFVLVRLGAHPTGQFIELRQKS